MKEGLMVKGVDGNTPLAGKVVQPNKKKKTTPQPTILTEKVASNPKSKPQMKKVRFTLGAAIIGVIVGIGLFLVDMISAKSNK